MGRQYGRRNDGWLLWQSCAIPNHVLWVRPVSCTCWLLGEREDFLRGAGVIPPRTESWMAGVGSSHPTGTWRGRSSAPRVNRTKTTRPLLARAACNRFSTCAANSLIRLGCITRTRVDSALRVQRRTRRTVPGGTHCSHGNTRSRSRRTSTRRGSKQVASYRG
jgi:hypothetical protein